MRIVKMIGMILLAIYLILTGLSAMSEMQLAPAARFILDLIAIFAGVLILITVGRCLSHKHHETFK